MAPRGGEGGCVAAAEPHRFLQALAKQATPCNLPARAHHFFLYRLTFLGGVGGTGEMKHDWASLQIFP